VLYGNQGAGRFTRAEGGDLGRFLLYAASMAWADSDADGDLDLYVGNWPNEPGEGERNHLYVNRLSGGNWLAVRLEGRESNRSAIGARISAVTLREGQRLSQIREVAAHSGWRSQSPLVQHFGLGQSDEVRELTVRWPSGAVDRLTAIPANQVLSIVEGQAPQARGD
jgi:hypothetical protein